jgi:hypothetical protein
MQAKKPAANALDLPSHQLLSANADKVFKRPIPQAKPDQPEMSRDRFEEEDPERWDGMS